MSERAILTTKAAICTWRGLEIFCLLAHAIYMVVRDDVRHFRHVGSGIRNHQYKKSIYPYGDGFPVFDGAE
jgi:hypothetical protein